MVCDALQEEKYNMTVMRRDQIVKQKQETLAEIENGNKNKRKNISRIFFSDFFLIFSFIRNKQPQKSEMN